MNLPQEIIRIKRDGGSLNRAQINDFVTGVVDGTFRDYQTSALLMAIVLRGMSHEETAHLTEAMMHSGRMVQLDEITRPKIDKHSTGGVGDKVSLILAPLAAALGLCVPMMSGRGLGHTGGTLDKLEAIPGFSVELDEVGYRAQLLDIHQAMIGQSSDIVPADRKLYALRDVTSTVESIPLICASILSKKFAEGIDALVLDVKCGLGAFMKTEAQARELATALVRISTTMGKPTSALITRMDQPLGCCVGHSLEVMEAIECLKGRGPSDLKYVTHELVAEMMRLGGLCDDHDSALAQIRAALNDGSALEAFRQLIIAQGGDATVIEDANALPQAAHFFDICNKGTDTSYISCIDALKVGEAVHLLGAGRTHADTVIDLSVGVRFFKKVGESVAPGEAVCRLYYNDRGKFDQALERLDLAISYSADHVVAPDILIDQIHKI